MQALLGICCGKLLPGPRGHSSLHVCQEWQTVFNLWANDSDQLIMKELQGYGG